MFPGDKDSPAGFFLVSRIYFLFIKNSYLFVKITHGFVSPDSECLSGCIGPGLRHNRRKSFMRQDMDRRENTQEYQFIQETIKKQPTDRRKMACRLLTIAGCGVLFGGCAAATFAGMVPVLTDREENIQQKIELADSGTMEKTEAVSEEKTVETENTVPDVQEEKSPLALYGETYKEVLKIAQESQKSLVTVCGISQDENLLDNSYMQQGDSEGLIFLETDTQFYILTYEEELENLHELQITFADGTTVSGEICKGDEDTELAVATGKMSLLDENTIEEIKVSDLTDTQSPSQSDLVIAIGSPAGDSDAVVYGMVTSVSEKLSAADTEYEVLSTDMQGSEDGSGILLDTSGNVTGMILKGRDSDGDNIHALSISQILPLVERLSNGEKSRYTGIYGKEIDQAQCRHLGIGQGLYVERTENASPAMKAGIQSGDIISKIDGNLTESMQSYYTYLQTKKAGEKITVTALRKNSGGDYVEKDYTVTIEER